MDEKEIGTVAEILRAHVPEEWNELTSRIIGLAMEVHTILGPGLLEKLYEDALVYELTQAGFRVDLQRVIHPIYKSTRLSQLRLDLVVNDLVIVELKSLEKIPEFAPAQLVSQLRSANLPLGLLLNFNVSHLKDGIYRRINARACPQRARPPMPPAPVTDSVTHSRG